MPCVRFSSRRQAIVQRRALVFSRYAISLLKGCSGKGVSLILDATNLSERYREHLYSITDRLDIKLVLVHVEAPPLVVYERLQSRLRNSEGKSDADWRVYQKM